ncbi:unnamed protein product, partial [Brassica oleracea]
APTHQTQEVSNPQQAFCFPLSHWFSPQTPTLPQRMQTDPTEHTTDDVPNKTSNRFAEHASSVNAFVATATSKRTSLPTLNMEQSQVLPAKPTPRHQPSDEECNLAEELLKCPSIPTLALIAPLPQQQWDLFHSTLTSNKQAFHITPSQFDFSNKFILEIAEPRKWVTTFTGLKLYYFLIADYVGHIKLVGEQALTAGLVLDEVEIASSRRLMVHVQTHDGPVMKLYLWDKAATDFCEKFKAHGNTPSVILVTTVNPKRFGGALTLSSLSSSRVFLDLDVQPTRDYLTWLDSNTDVANRVNPDIVTKAETVTIGDLFSYIKLEGSKVAWFECTATIDDVVHGSAWYYISCGGCKTKATKGHTTLMCKKCGKAEVTGVPDVGDDHMVPVPQALIDTIGQTRTFIVKVSKHNLDGKIRSLTVTKVLPLEAAAADGNLEENVIVSAVEETLQMGKRVDGSSSEHEGSTDAAVKRSFDGDESEEAKRAKCG